MTVIAALLGIFVTIATGIAANKLTPLAPPWVRSPFGAGPLHGRWYDLIPAQPEDEQFPAKPERVDEIVGRQWRGETLHARGVRKGSRQDPEYGKRWRFRAIQRSDYVTGHFWSTDRRKTDSHGSFMLKRVNDDLWAGYYWKMLEDKSGQRHLRQTKYFWRKDEYHRPNLDIDYLG